MIVDYNKIANGFSDSRKKMKWEEIDYFISNYLDNFKWKDILDIWCGSARLLEQFSGNFDINDINYLWLDLSDEMLNYARNNYPNKDFVNLNMLDLDKLEAKKYDYIFLVASFHHLDNLDDRLKVLKNVYNLLKKDWLVFMTNWALKSDVNNDKYKNDIIANTENEFWSTDYNVYFWDYPRFYHCFDLKELDYLFKESYFEIIENREFDNEKNNISILKKIWD